MIKNFTDFINEAAYLLGHRQPLYHFTSSLNRIMETDLLKLGNPVRGFNGKLKAICVTRNPDFAEHGDIFIELDYSKLYNDGYRAYPVDEWAWQKDGTANPKNKTYNFNKSQFPEVLSGRRGTKHGVKSISHKKGILETEFEERIFKEIKKLGKYIISINFPIGSGVSKEILERYIEKYPHIKVYNVTKDHRVKVDITNYKKEPEKKEDSHYVDSNGNIVWKDGKYIIESVNDNMTSIIEELLDTISTILADLMDFDKVKIVPIDKIESNLNDPDLDYSTSIVRIDLKDESIERIENITRVLTHYIGKNFNFKFVLGITSTSGSTKLISGIDFDNILKELNNGKINVMTIMIQYM